MAKHITKLVGKFSQIFKSGIRSQNVDEGRRLLVKILSELEEKPESRKEFIKYSATQLDDPDVIRPRHEAPLEIIEFCMRKLQWPEVRQQLEKRLAAETESWGRDLFRRIIARAYQGEKDGVMLWDMKTYGDVPPKS